MSKTYKQFKEKLRNEYACIYVYAWTYAYVYTDLCIHMCLFLAPAVTNYNEFSGLKRCKFGTSHCGSAVTNPTSTCENVGPIPGLTQWVKDPTLP